MKRAPQQPSVIIGSDDAAPEVDPYHRASPILEAVLRANADVPAATGSNGGRAGRKPRARKLRSLGGYTLGSHHVIAVAPVPIAGPEQRWQRNSPNSLVRTPLRFTSEADRQLYRKGLRALILVYAGILALVVAITVLRGEWRNQDVAAKATAGAVDIPRR